MSKYNNFLMLFHPITFVRYTQRCIYNFGARFVFFLTISYFSLKGFSRALVELSELPYYEITGRPAEDYQLNRTISSLPNSLKGFVGVLTDTLPLFGYHKRYYMYITALLGGIASIIITFLPYSVMDHFLQLPALIFFFIQFECSMHDLLNEGVYVEKMNIRPESRGDIVSYVVLYQTIGSIGPALMVGLTAENIDIRYLYITLIPLTLHPIVAIYFGCFIEKKVPKEKSNRVDWIKVKKDWKIFTMATAIAFCALFSVLIAIFGTNLIRFIYVIIVSVFLGIIGFFLMDPIIAKANLYLFICNSLYINITGPVDYFYIAKKSCVAEGPNFDYTYFRTYASLVQILAEFTSIFLFQVIFAKLKYRHTLWSTTFIRMLASIFDIIIVTRFNVTLGISDRVLFMIGSAMIYNMAYKLDFIPMSTMMSKLCSKSLETTMFAILAGFSNFGINLANYTGIYLADIFNVKLGANIDCQYENLPYLILVSHCILPALSIPLTFFLIPDVYVGDDIMRNYNIMNMSQVEKI